tara:strand:- start:203 stop:1576 length:1374 start_codon:yes stop_codon:yes gene_type:complete
MTSKIVVNNIGSDTGINTVTFDSNVERGSSNLHSVGLEAAGINVLGADTPIGTGSTIYDDGGARFSGIVTATAFHGDGSSLTGVGASFGNSSINTSGIITATAFVPTSQGALSHRNKVHNGAMQISQRYGTTAYTSPNSSKNYTIDRWAYWSNQASKASVQQVTDAPVGFYNSAKCTVVSAHTAASGEWFGYTTGIEGQDIYDLAQGTANAKSFTLSFYVKSSVTGTWAAAVRTKASSPDRSYPFNYTINSANTWERKTITIPGAPNGTWGTGNNEGMCIWFDLGTGSGFHQTANQWYSGNATGPSASPFIANAGATWLVTGVQLEVGPVATPFEHRSFGDELRRCQRYYQQYVNISAVGYVPNNNARSYSHGFFFPVTMRAAPTISITNTGSSNGQYISDGDTNRYIASTLSSGSHTTHMSVSFNLSGDLANFRGAYLFGTTNTTYQTTYKITAEL